MQVDGQHGDQPEEQAEDHHDEDDSNSKTWDSENPQVQESLIAFAQAELPQHERDERDDGGHPHNDGDETAGHEGFNVAERVDEPAEPDGRQWHRYDVEWFFGGFPHVTNVFHPHQQDEYDEGNHEPENEMPAEIVEDEPGHGGAERGGERNHDGHHAHEGTAHARGHHIHDGGHEQGHNQRGSSGLQHPAAQQH